MNGKGDARRPTTVPPATVAENWARTFDVGPAIKPPLDSLFGGMCVVSDEAMSVDAAYCVSRVDHGNGEITVDAVTVHGLPNRRNT